MNKISLIEGCIGFFVFPVLDIFEMFFFSVFALKIFGFSVLVSNAVFGFPLFLVRFGFWFLLIERRFLVFVIRLSSS